LEGAPKTVHNIAPHAINEDQVLKQSDKGVILANCDVRERSVDNSIQALQGREGFLTRHPGHGQRCKHPSPNPENVRADLSFGRDSHDEPEILHHLSPHAKSPSHASGTDNCENWIVSVDEEGSKLSLI
jgi:hypothetical protein